MPRLSTFHWLLIVALAALIVYSVGTLTLYLGINQPENVTEDITEIAPFWLFWAIHAPLIPFLSRRFSFERTRLFKSLVLYILVGISWALLVQWLPYLLLPFLKNFSSVYSDQYDRLKNPEWLEILKMNLMVYWVVLSSSLIYIYYGRYQDETLKASRLDSQLSNARLQALKMQLHPHFLFNTLHSITALVLKNENRDAVKMISRLSEFLRLTLDTIQTQVLSLEEEIDFTRRYLEIERIRFHDRLAVEWDIHPQVLTAQVPSLILQPLVENVMRHVVDSNSGTSRVQIAAHLRNNHVVMEVRDDGKDLAKISEQHGAAGMGLNNIRARLSELYGKDSSFNLSRNENEWTIAQIVIPFQPTQRGSK